MDNRTETYEATLCPAAVDEFSGHVRAFLASRKLPKREILRYAMTVEELLLKSIETNGSGAELRLSMGKKFRQYFITLEIAGEACNVYAADAEEQGVLGASLLKNLGLSPEYRFSQDRNRYSFRIRRKNKNPFVPLILAAVLAVALGFLGRLFPTGTREMLLNELLQPINDTFLDLLGCLAGPMIFLSVVWGIYGIGDAATLKNIGKKLCGGYVGTMFVLAGATTLLCLPFFHLNSSSGGGAVSGLSSVFSTLLGVVPKDLFSPFVNRNTLQIIFIGVVLGIAMLFLGQKTDFVAKVVEQINNIVQFLIETISTLVPVFIFVVVLKLIWSGMLGSLSGIGKLVGTFVGSSVLGAVVLALYTGFVNKVNPMLVVKKCLNTFLIAFSTASSAASFSSNIKATGELGIDDKLSSFGVPLGVVIFKPSSAMSNMLMCLFFAELYGIEVSPAWIAIMIFTATILSVSTPPIPGGGMATYTVLFSQLGIPMEALAIALACDSVFDFVITGFNQFGIPFALLNKAGKLGLVDRAMLLQDGKRKK